jgi:hypothetical protein
MVQASCSSESTMSTQCGMLQYRRELRVGRFVSSEICRPPKSPSPRHRQRLTRADGYYLTCTACPLPRTAGTQRVARRDSPLVRPSGKGRVSVMLLATPRTRVQHA